MKAIKLAILLFASSILALGQIPKGSGGGGGGGGGGSIPSVVNLLKGDGTGSAADSGIPPASVLRFSGVLASTAVPSINGSGAAIDSGCTIASIVLTCSGGFAGGSGTMSLTGLEGTAPVAPAAGQQTLFIDSTTHKLTTINNSSAITVYARVIAAGSTSLATASITSFTCATVVTAAATGTLTTDSIAWNPNASIKAVTGYVPASGGGLTIAAYPTANAVNFDVCNWTTGSITPGAVTLNWSVNR